MARFRLWGWVQTVAGFRLAGSDCGWVQTVAAMGWVQTVAGFRLLVGWVQIVAGFRLWLCQTVAGVRLWLCQTMAVSDCGYVRLWLCQTVAVSDCGCVRLWLAVSDCGCVETGGEYRRFTAVSPGKPPLAAPAARLPAVPAIPTSVGWSGTTLHTSMAAAA